MAMVYYENLDGPGTYRPDLVSERAFRSFSPMVRYLRTARDATRHAAWYVEWEGLNAEEVQAILRESEEELSPSSQEKVGEAEREAEHAGHEPREPTDKKQHDTTQSREGPVGFWVRIMEPELEDLSEQLLEEFYDADFVYETQTFQRQAMIRVLDVIESLNLLCLERRPVATDDGARLYLRPNTISIERQLRAIEKLQNRPHPSQRGLLSLLEKKDRAPWKPFNKINPAKWYILNETSRPGTEEQREFVRIALGTPDFAILEGPPGSGKTTTIAELILQLIQTGKRVLLSASTHVAVDNVLERIADRKDVLAVRVGNEHNISPEMRKYQVGNWISTHASNLVKRLVSLKQRTASQDRLLDLARSQVHASSTREVSPFFRLMLECSNLVCGTTIGIIAGIHLFDVLSSGRGAPPFDVLILDEASKTPFTEFLVPAILAKRWIITGDIKQLSPYVETDQIRANVRGLLPETRDQATVQAVFGARGPKLFRGKPAVIVSYDEDHMVRSVIQGLMTSRATSLLDEEVREAAEKRVKALGYSDEVLTHLLAPTDKNPVEMHLALFGSEVIVGSQSTIEEQSGTIPHDVTIVGDLNSQTIKGRTAWWENRNRSDAETREWSNEIAWRLVRCHELRLDANNPRLQEFRSDLEALIPKFVNSGEQDSIRRALSQIESIALPSVIELVQQGFSRTSNPESQTALNSGLPSAVLEDRLVRLSYQHRMHPDISCFPRYKFYSNEALKDPDYILKSRDWGYESHIGKKRVVWSDIIGNEEKPTRNRQEADAVIQELKNFLDWTESNTPGGREYWEVALLTFYRGQERLITRSVAQLLHTSPRRVFWCRKTGRNLARIEVCTVDRFQGHEADYVILSLVRTRRVGFLDSPNRLNVALTRARYQLLIIGNRAFFAKSPGGRALHDLARDTQSAPRMRTYQRRPQDSQSTQLPRTMPRRGRL